LKAKEYLQQIRSIDAEIYLKESERRRIWNEATKTTANLSDDAVFSNNTSDKVGKNSVELADIDTAIKHLESKRKKIIDVIMQLDCLIQVKIIYKHYAEGKKLTVISKEIGYSYQRTVELHLIALKNLEKILSSYQNI